MLGSIVLIASLLIFWKHILLFQKVYIVKLMYVKQYSVDSLSANFFLEVYVEMMLASLLSYFRKYMMKIAN